MIDALLGLDIGTSSTKAVLVSTDGTVLTVASTSNYVSSPQQGWFEHDAETTWWLGCVKVIRDALAQAGTDVRVIGVGLSACGPCFVPVDARGRPLRAGILYGVDTRATSDIEDLQSSFSTDEVSEAFGMPFTSQTSGAKVKWLARVEPEIFEQTRSLLTANGFLAFRLTGNQRADHHQAAYFAPYYRNGVWDDATSIRSLFPELAWSDEVVGRVTEAAARETGLSTGVPVVIGSSDGLAGMYGAGCRRPGSAVLNYGTTMGLSILSTTDVTAGGLWRTPGAVEGETMLVGALSTAGALLDWMARTLRDPDAAGSDEDKLERFVAVAADTPPGSNGLLMLPYFAGERTPFYDPGATGALLGLRLEHTPADIFRSALESTAYGVRHLLDEVKVMGFGVTELRAVGGGTATDLWPQIVSDVTGVEQGVVNPNLGAPLGAAFLAAVGTGAVSGVRAIEDWVRISHVLIPDADQRALHDRCYQAFLDAYTGTRGLNERLRE